MLAAAGQLPIVADETCEVEVQIRSIGVEFKSWFYPLQVADSYVDDGVEQLANPCKFFTVAADDVDPEKLPAGQAG